MTIQNLLQKFGENSNTQIKKIIFICVFCYFLPSLVFTQNLIPNASFETKSSCPEKLQDFSVVSWSPTFSLMTPDYFNECAPDTSSSSPHFSWIDISPKDGKGYIGLVTFLRKGEAHEYVSVQLKETLKEYQHYKLSFWIAIPKLSRWRNNNLGIHFTKKKVFKTNLRAMRIQPHLSFNTKLISLGRWQKVSLDYVAYGGEKYLTLGNFTTNKETSFSKIKGRTNKTHGAQFACAYYLFDQFSFTEFPSKIPEISIDTSEVYSFNSIGDTSIYQFSNLNFDLNSAKIKDEQLHQLNTIVSLLLKKPQHSVHIIGHTDQLGSSNENQVLSEKRAIRIANFFQEKGISSARISSEGKGSSNPIYFNAENAPLNRRVEIKIIQ